MPLFKNKNGLNDSGEKAIVVPSIALNKKGDKIR